MPHPLSWTGASALFCVTLALPVPSLADDLADLKEEMQILQRRVEVLETQLGPLRRAEEERREYIRELKDLHGYPAAIESTGEPVVADTDLAAGQILQAKCGPVWWAVKVREVLNEDEVSVHYVGWDPMYDEVVPRTRLQLDPNALKKAREAVVTALFGWQQEPIDGLDGSAGPIASTDEIVTNKTTLSAGQMLQVESGGYWWAAKVLEVLGNDRVRIHYLGWDLSYDEVVERSRLQLDPEALEKARGAVVPNCSLPTTFEPAFPNR